MIIQETGHLVSCSDDGLIYIWNYPKKKIVETIERKEGFLCLTYSLRTKFLYAGTDKNNLLCFPIKHIFDMDLSEFDSTMDLKEYGLEEIENLTRPNLQG